MASDLTINELTQLFQEKTMETQEEPEFQRSIDKTKYAAEKDGMPLVQLAVGNVPLDYDLWEGLRNPAVVGMFPAGLPEIWEFYANRRKQKVDETGRQTIFQIPRSFDFALRNFRRAVIVSVWLPFPVQIFHDYVNQVNEKRNGSSHLYASSRANLDRMLDKVITRAAIDLVTDDSERVVVPMHNDGVKAVSTEVIPQTRQGESHGPRKNGSHYSQKSIAVLLGLGQFGVSRLVFRDELTNGKVQRFAGSTMRSIIIFDKNELVTDGSDGIVYPSPAWREFLIRLYDFTNADPDINKYRFCTYMPLGDSGCGKCVEYCPSGAQLSSVPKPDGNYSEAVARQPQRFWEGKLQFDDNKCCDYRGQMGKLYPEWSCSRCLAVCVDRGMRRKNAIQNFYSKMSELTKKVTRTPVPA